MSFSILARKWIAMQAVGNFCLILRIKNLQESGLLNFILNNTKR